MKLNLPMLYIFNADKLSDDRGLPKQEVCIKIKFTLHVLYYDGQWGANDTGR